ncbi:WD40-repeat-containing domain protein [Endogone sp. FLAS-F59071]|nr:WD40-repeat-containing domain protein [Endogone sp. FLAS-F59071]|eukprot:RUS14159.1 WD40-repeat-containing domain protein [Endogone sp. FLAS-F59071]
MSIIVWESSENKERKFGEDDVTGDQEGWRVVNMMLCVVFFYSHKTLSHLPSDLTSFVHAYRGHRSEIYELAWSPDGRHILTGSIDSTARMWDVTTSAFAYVMWSTLSSRYPSILTYRVHEYGALVPAEQCIHVFTEHSHYVQGVAWDPLGQYLATQSSDRSVQIYQYAFNSADGSVAVTSLARHAKLDPARAVVADANTEPAGRSFNLYHDETLVSFFRRLTFTPDGALLLTPAGVFKGVMTGTGETEEEVAEGRLDVEEKRIEKEEDWEEKKAKEDESGEKKKAKEDESGGGGKAKEEEVGAEEKEKESETEKVREEVRNTVYLYVRGALNRSPVAHLPNHKKPSIAVRCNPVLFQLRPSPLDPSLIAATDNIRKRPVGLDENMADNSSEDLGSEDEDEDEEDEDENDEDDEDEEDDDEDEDDVTDDSSQGGSVDQAQGTIPPRGGPLFALPYRIVYAVATQDSVLVYDTQQVKPIAMMAGFHYATVTDLAWSPDGTTLIFTSTDGYCSAVAFDDGELGVPYSPPTLASLAPLKMQIDSVATPKPPPPTTNTSTMVPSPELRHPGSHPQQQLPQKKRRIQPTFEVVIAVRD